MAIRGLASRISGKSFQVMAAAANATPADGAGFDIGKFEAAVFMVEHLGGSQGSINVTLQHADSDVNASYSAVPDAQIEVPKDETLLPSSGVLALTNSNTGFREYGYKGNKRFIRTISSGASGTPNFTMRNGAVAMRKRHIGG